MGSSVAGSRTAGAERLRERAPALAAAATVRLAGDDPGTAAALATVSAELGRDLGVFHLQHLATALEHDAPVLLRAYLSWVHQLLRARGLEPAQVTGHLEQLVAVLEEGLGPQLGGRARGLVDRTLLALAEGVAEDGSELDAGSPHAALATRLLELLLAGDRAGATGLVLRALDDGIAIEALEVDVLAPCLREVGRRWQRDEIPVAAEHLATATLQLVMAQLYPHLLGAPRGQRRAVVAAVGGELHEVGARMVADLLELHGWTVRFLGASTPVEDIVRLVAAEDPDLLAVSATLAIHVEQVHRVIEAVRRVRPVPVLVGGRPFQQDGQLWRRIGADGTAGDAREAVAVAQRLVADG